MKYINVTELKKQAKKERKNNNEIKNQAESLNFIAKKHNKENWQDLLNDCVLPLKDESIKFHFSPKIIMQFTKLMSAQMIIFRNNSFVRKGQEKHSIQCLSAIHEVSDCLHNIGQLFDYSRSKEQIEHSVLYHKKYFTHISKDSIEISFSPSEKHKIEIIPLKHWIVLFDDMLEELR